MRVPAFLACLIAAPALAQDGAPAADPVPAPEPALVIYDYEIVSSHPHDPLAYTQGLFFDEGQLWESTGQVGRSSLRRVDLESGEVEAQFDVPPPYFGEGSVAIGDRVYMVTWRLGAGFIFDKETLEEVGAFDISGEGWGLTTDGESLILSDGTNVLRYLDPESGRVTRRLEVSFRGRAVEEINELEYVDGQIWANIYGSTEAIRIDPETGYLTGVVNFARLFQEVGVPNNYDHVPNGIAWDGEDPDVLHVTGKQWPQLYEIRLSEMPD